MLDTILNNVNSILSMTIGGISLATIIAMVITLVIEIHKAHKESQLTKKSIEDAFKDAVFPKNIKIDLSKKIEPLITDLFNSFKKESEELLERVTRGEELILSVLNQFTHVQKLPTDVQDEIKEYIDGSNTETLEL